ncbi:hypothetical protein TNCV_3662321 [Trichonephila clavipes]|nr:hypothetical protein TNCV_3662321 [Trichonephila clavipes]
MRWPGQVLEVRLRFSELILNIIVHEVSVAIKMKNVRLQGTPDLPVNLDSYKERVMQDAFTASYDSRQIRRLPSVQNKT